MSAEILRRAASLMRERARRAAREAEDTGPWSTSWDHSVLTSDGAQMADCFDSGLIAEHIASWHPAVALAVASELEREGAAWEQVIADHPDLAEAAEKNIAKSGWLAVARAYLGGQP